MSPIVFPPMSAAQTQAWQALIELGARFDAGWTLVGGQLVHLHCRERGASPSRPTDDGDAALDVRAHPDILRNFTDALLDLGFVSDTPSALRVQHRWVRDLAVIDVLIPRHLGERASSRRGAGGQRTIAAPGAQGALDRTERVEVTVAGRTGEVPRPTLVGAIAAKAAALEIADDPRWKRHVQDLVILSTLIRRGDDFTVYSTRDFQRVRNAIGRTVADPSIAAPLDGAADGIARLRLALDSAEHLR
ncbi:MAG: hypothetical protein WBL06_09010 [Pseudolysinimonas sp.]|jgi:hypothetical protein